MSPARRDPETGVVRKRESSIKRRRRKKDDLPETQRIKEDNNNNNSGAKTRGKSRGDEKRRRGSKWRREEVNYPRKTRNKEGGAKETIRKALFTHIKRKTPITVRKKNPSKEMTEWERNH